MAIKKKQNLSISEKKNVLKIYTSNKTLSYKKIQHIAKTKYKLKISISTISRIISKQNYLNSVDESPRRRQTCPKHSELEDKLYSWLVEKEEKRIPISNLVLQKKAQQIGNKMGIVGFGYSTGWLRGFKRRKMIKIRQYKGESGSAEVISCKDEMDLLKSTINNIHPSNIYNFDETSFFYQLLPHKTNCTKRISGYKISKKRITIGCCINSTGTHKLPLLIVGISKKPRCFSNYNVQDDFFYFYNRKAWVTKDIFNQYLTKINRIFKEKIVLIVDNFAAHKLPESNKFININLQFLPPNVTSLYQPLDQGIIWSLKSIYRSKLVDHYLLKEEQEKEIGNINLKESLTLLKISWNEVDTQTIQNCWAKAGFIADGTTQKEVISEVEETKEDVIKNMLESKIALFKSNDVVKASEYIDIDTKFEEEIFSGVSEEEVELVDENTREVWNERASKHLLHIEELLGNDDNGDLLDKDEKIIFEKWVQKVKRKIIENNIQTKQKTIFDFINKK